MSTTPPPPIDDVLAELVEEFEELRQGAADLGMPERELVDDHILDMGKALKRMPESLKVQKNRVSGCASRTWLVANAVGDRLYFVADSESIFSRGTLALVLRLLSGQPAREIYLFDTFAALDRIGLPSGLSHQRAGGVRGVVSRIREIAEVALSAR